MNKNWEELERRFDEQFGKPKEGFEIQTIDGREFCMMCGAPTKVDRVYKEIKSFIKSELEAQEEEMLDKFRNDPKYQTPMGVSQWMNHGEKYHYVEFWENKIKEAQKKEMRDEIVEMILSDGIIYCTQHSSNNAYKMCDVCETVKLIKDRMIEIIRSNKNN